MVTRSWWICDYTTHTVHVRSTQRLSVGLSDSKHMLFSLVTETKKQTNPITPFLTQMLCVILNLGRAFKRCIDSSVSACLCSTLIFDNPIVLIQIDANVLLMEQTNESANA